MKLSGACRCNENRSQVVRVVVVFTLVWLLATSSQALAWDGWRAQASSIGAPEGDEPSCVAEGKSILASALQRDPEKPLYNEERLRLAIATLKKCVQRHPTSAFAHYYLGDCYYTDNRYDKAIEHYEEAAQLAPRWFAAPYMMGMIYTFNKRNRALAEKLLKKAISLNPDAYYVQVDLGRHYLFYGNTKAAVAALDKAFSIEKRLAFEHASVAGAMPLEERELAIEHYKRALTLYPGYTLAKEGLERLQKPQNKRTTDARKLLPRKIVDVEISDTDPGCPRGHTTGSSATFVAK